MRQPGEPSVEAILASIKQVMARDAAALTGGAQTSQTIAPMPHEPVLDLSREQVVSSAPPAATPLPAAPLMGDGAAASTRGALHALASIAGTAPAGADPRGGNGSLEGMVRELLRPALAAWLDANLPPLVERLVAAEIARIVGQRG